MSTQVFLYCDNDTVYAGSWGLMEYGSWTDIFCGALALAGIHRIRNLLIDLRQTRLQLDRLFFQKLPLSFEYIYQSRLYKMAAVAEPGTPEFAFYETVFRNRGSRLQIFDEYDKAAVWLRPVSRVPESDLSSQNEPAGILNEAEIVAC